MGFARRGDRLGHPGAWARIARKFLTYPTAAAHSGGDIDGPKPYEFIWFGDIHGPEPYEFIWFGDIDGPKHIRFPFMGGKGPSTFQRAK